MVKNHTSPVLNPSLDAYDKSSACTNYILQWRYQSKFNFFTAILVVNILLTLLPLKGSYNAHFPQVDIIL